MDEQKQIVLEFKDAEFFALKDYAVKIEDFKLYEGDVGFIKLDNFKFFGEIADLIEGLTEIEKGEVFFRGKSWKSLRHSDSLDLRSQIGRVFKSHAWINNLTVLENIILKTVHHTKKPFKLILNEAEETGKLFGINEIPNERITAEGVTLENLLIYQWIRAFLNNPKLIILEDPFYFASEDKMQLLFNVVTLRRKQGSAFIFIINKSDEIKLKELEAKEIKISKIN